MLFFSFHLHAPLKLLSALDSPERKPVERSYIKTANAPYYVQGFMDSAPGFPFITISIALVSQRC